MHPCPTKNETPTLVPDLNRGTNTGMDRVDVNAHLDATGKRHGTSQGPTKSLGEIVEPAKLIWKLKRKNSWESNGNSKGRRQTSPWSNQPKESTKRIRKDSKLTELKLNPHGNKRHHRIRLTRTDEMMMKEFFQRKEEDRKWEKKEKPDSA